MTSNLTQQKTVYAPPTSGNCCSSLSQLRAEQAEELSPFSRHTPTACSGRNGGVLNRKRRAVRGVKSFPSHLDEQEDGNVIEQFFIGQSALEIQPQVGSGHQRHH